jgi:hypothetical protein
MIPWSLEGIGYCVHLAWDIVGSHMSYMTFSMFLIRVGRCMIDS